MFLRAHSFTQMYQMVTQMTNWLILSGRANKEHHRKRSLPDKGTQGKSHIYFLPISPWVTISSLMIITSCHPAYFDYNNSPSSEEKCGMKTKAFLHTVSPSQISFLVFKHGSNHSGVQNTGVLEFRIILSSEHICEKNS